MRSREDAKVYILYTYILAPQSEAYIWPYMGIRFVSSLYGEESNLHQISDYRL